MPKSEVEPLNQGRRDVANNIVKAIPALQSLLDNPGRIAFTAKAVSMNISAVNS